MDLGLTQRGAAERMGVSKRAVVDWEMRRFAPTVSCVPAVIRFLGHDPRPEPTFWPDWLAWYRGGQGLSQNELALQLGVSSRTLWLWETGRSKPAGRNLTKLCALRDKR
jgi:DNA-binding transcriptional regulator YiaG